MPKPLLACFTCWLCSTQLTCDKLTFKNPVYRIKFGGIGKTMPGFDIYKFTKIYWCIIFSAYKINSSKLTNGRMYIYVTTQLVSMPNPNEGS